MTATMIPHTSPVQLHRARFLDHTPSPITAISFAPLPLPPPEVIGKGKGKAIRPEQDQGSEEFGALIIARENGFVEVWQWTREDEGGVGNWVLERSLPPTLIHPTVSLITLVIRDPLNFHKKPYRVPNLEDLRLFTAGSESSELVERCLLTGRILTTYPISSPPIWSLSVSPTHSLLCLSTTAQTLTFLSIPSDGASSPLEPPPPHLLRTESLPSKTRTVSVAWGPPKAVLVGDEWEWRDTYVVTGNSDSSFRKWNLPEPSDGQSRGAGRVMIAGRSVVEKVQKAGRGGGKKGGGGNQKGTIVWGVGVLPDHTIVTSDSLGSVTFWDGRSLAQKQTFQAHKADGMCLTIGPSGRTVYSSGPDQRVSQFTLIPSGSGESWRQTANRRIHSHDVKAMAIFPPYTPFTLPINPIYCPVLASGGWDMSLALTPAGSAQHAQLGSLINPLGKLLGMSRILFEESFARKMSYMGGGRGTSAISVSRGARLVLVRKERSVGIWRVFDEEQGWEKVLEMDLRLRTSLISSAISQDGQWLAISDLYETKLFHLTTTPSMLKPRRVATFHQSLVDSPILSHLDLESTGHGSSAVLFTPDSQRLIMGLVASSQVVVVELPPQKGEGDVRIMKCFKRSEMMAGGRVVKPRKRDQKAAKRAAAAALEANGMTGDDVHMANGGTDGTPQKKKSKINGLANGTGANGHVDADEDEDEPMAPPSLEEPKGSGNAWISTLASSEDGQWLAVSDLLRRVSIFNLDTLRQTASLPTLPQTPVSLSFPPSHPSLLCLTAPTGSLTFYHLEHRRFLLPTAQIQRLNSTLRGQYTPAEGVAFEPTRSGVGARNTKLIVWSHDWIATARIDLDLLARQLSRKGNYIHGTGPGYGSGSGSASGSLHAQAISASATISTSASVAGSPLIPSPLKLNGNGNANGPSVQSPSTTATTTAVPDDAVADEGSPITISKAVRRKRAREAREALEQISLSDRSNTPSDRLSTPMSSTTFSYPPPPPSLTGVGGADTKGGMAPGLGGSGGWSSKDDPEFCKVISDRFRGVGAVDWLGEGEVIVVERPFGDFVAELPQAFWSGSFGRA